MVIKKNFHTNLYEIVMTRVKEFAQSFIITKTWLLHEDETLTIHNVIENRPFTGRSSFFDVSFSFSKVQTVIKIIL